MARKKKNPASTSGHNNRKKAIQGVDSRPLAVKAFAIMVAEYGMLPKALWDLCASQRDPTEKRILCLRGWREPGQDYFNHGRVVEQVLAIRRFDFSEIKMDYTFSAMLPPLPVKVKQLTTDNSFNEPFILPTKVEVVNLGRAFNQQETGSVWWVYGHTTIATGVLDVGELNSNESIARLAAGTKSDYEIVPSPYRGAACVSAHIELVGHPC